VAAARTTRVLGQAGGKPTVSQTGQALTLGSDRGFLIAGIVVAIAAVVALLGTRASDIQHATPEPEIVVAEEAEASVTGLGSVGPSLEAMVPVDVDAGDDNGRS
jgi:hypothetical protein